MRSFAIVSLFPATALLLALGGLSGCAPSGPPATQTGNAAPAGDVYTGTVAAVRHADPATAADALGRIMAVLNRPLPSNAGPGTEIVVKLSDGSVKSIVTQTDPSFTAGQAVTITKTPDDIAIHPG